MDQPYLIEIENPQVHHNLFFFYVAIVSKQSSSNVKYMNFIFNKIAWLFHIDAR